VILVIVPALLMVSTLRFRSFKTIDLGERRRYQILIALAAILAAIVTFPHEMLLGMAYAYLLSGFVDLALHKMRRRDHEPHDAAPAAEHLDESSSKA
jgi:CDP-diacylglycerol--serine O-phosphatidyltransferase